MSSHPSIPSCFKDHNRHMTHLHEVDLPSELIHRIHEYVGPHPCAKIIRDFCVDIEYPAHEESLIRYNEWYGWCETKLRLRCIHETMTRLLVDRPDGVYLLNPEALPSHGPQSPLSDMRTHAAPE